MTNALHYANLTPEKIEKYSPAETLVKGNPKQFVEVFYQDDTSKFRSAIWEGEPGAYRLTFAPNKHEFFYLLSGKVRVHSEDGSTIDVGAGESCVIPGGFNGVFEIIEHARKHAVVAEGL
jgi:uncharacterized cupin superfamily protein